MSVPAFYYIFLSIRARSFFFFNAANPGITNGGMAMESKKAIYDILPAEYTPGTLYFEANTDVSFVSRSISDAGLTFPLIAKPDIGMKGKAVARINDEHDLSNYIAKAGFTFLIQEMIDFPNEIGVFFYRHPDSDHGTISGVVRKEFLTVMGDGSSSIRQLIEREPRFLIQLDTLTAQYGDRLDQVPERGEIIDLVPFGNHARGAKFTDASYLISPQLIATFDVLCLHIPGFYYGRLDIRYDSWEALERGENFSIIELNGAGSDPTHIFDPRHSIFWAWREICRHWRIMSDISIANHARGVPYLSFRAGVKMFQDQSAHIRSLDAFSAGHSQ